MRKLIIGAGLSALRASRAHRLAQRFTRGIGAVLMFHHVRPWCPVTPEYAPNRLLEITPEFFETVVVKVRALGFEIVTLDQAVERIVTAYAGAQVKQFVALTFDDGYRDNRDFALPILRKHSAPFTLFVTTGFADHSARLWWLELEEAVRRRPDGKSSQEKLNRFNELYWSFRAMPEDAAMAELAVLAAAQDIDPASFSRDLCMDWDELAAFARDPLCTVGAHTLTHPRLAKHPLERARREIAEGIAIIEEKLSAAPRHFAYPVGDPTSAGLREFALARELGLASAVTTRPGMLFPKHAAHLTALPRVSINGNWQNTDFIEVLLSGAPFALWNRGKRVNVS